MLPISIKMKKKKIHLMVGLEETIPVHVVNMAVVNN